MKNKYNVLLVLAIMIFVIGCSCGSLTDLTGSKDTSTEKKTEKTSDPNANKTLTDKVTDVATDGEKIGIPECDELMDYFRTKIESENTDFVTKAVLKTLEARFREGIKQSLEQNKSDKTETAKWCKEFKKNLDDQETKQTK
jgi:hypothetical protein